MSIHYAKPYWWTEIERRDRETREQVKAQGWRFYGDRTWDAKKLAAAGIPKYAWWTDQPAAVVEFRHELDENADANLQLAESMGQLEKLVEETEPDEERGVIHYAEPFWWVSIDRRDYQTKDLFKGEGWRFHGDRTHNKEAIVAAGVPNLVWFTNQPTSAAPFRDRFDEAAKGAFTETVEDDEKSRAADADIDVPCPPGMDYLPYQRAGIQWILERNSTLLGDQMGLGKAQPVSARVLAPHGWVRIGDLQPGNLIIGGDGQPTHVTGVFPRGTLPVYRVTFHDHTSLVVAEDHLWAARTNNDQHAGNPFRTIETSVLARKTKDASGNRIWRIPLIGSAPELDNGGSRPLPGYVLGVLLGDGHLAHHPNMFTPGDERVPAAVRQALPKGLVQTEVDEPGRERSYRILDLSSGRENHVIRSLKDMGLCDVPSEERFVPEAYRFSPAEVRLAVLQGLLDTDGEARDDTVIAFSSASERLMLDVCFLCRSLGGVARVNSPKLDPTYVYKGETRTGKTSYRCTLSFPDGVVPFRAQADSFVPKYLPNKIIESIEPCGHEDVVCISVAADHSLYVTEDFIVTHNTVQVLGAINGDARIRDVLCVVPASLTSNWAREAQKWLVRPANIVNLKTAYDVPEPAPPGQINFLITNYERLIEQKGKDEKGILATDGKAQDDEKGIRRVLQKMRKEPKLRNVLVVAHRPRKLDIKAATKAPRGAADWPEVEVHFADDIAQLREVVGQLRGGAEGILAEHDRSKGLSTSLTGAEAPSGPAQVVIIPMDREDKKHAFIREALHAFQWHVLVKDQIHVLVSRGRGFGLHGKLMEQKFDMLACDEAHVMSNPTAKQTVAVVGKEQRRSDAKPGIASRAKKLVFATGTPIRNRPVETWPNLHVLAPKTFTNFLWFAKRYCGAVRGRFGWDFTGATRKAEYEHVLRTGTEHHGLMIRRLKEDVLKELPPKFRHVVPLEVDTPEIEAVLEAEREIYDKYRDKVEKMISGGAPPPKQRGQIVEYAKEVGELEEAGPIPFAEISRIKAMVGKAKVEPAGRLIAQMLEGGAEKVVVFGEHYAVIDGLEDALKEYGVVQITGRTPQKDRMEIVDRFQNDKNTRVFIGNIKAAGVGLTLTAASTVVMVEATWVPALNEQAEDRCHRIGTVDNVNVLYLVFDGSIDQRVLEKVVEKMEVARDMLDAKITEIETIDVEDMFQALEEAIEEEVDVEPTFSGGPVVGAPRVRAASPRSPRKAKPKPAPPKQFTEKQRAAALTAMQSLASVCDGARKRDCMGFSGVTTGAGHWLAAHAELDNRQTQMAIRIATLHQRQLPSDLLSILGIEGGMAPERIEAPTRFRLMHRQLTWVVEYMHTVRDEPVQRRMYWPVREYDGALPSKSAGPILLVADGKDCFVGAPDTAIEDLRLCVDGNENAEQVDEWPVAPPKSAYPLRWHIGQWQRELKKGWADIAYKWMERAPRQGGAVKTPDVAAEPALFISDPRAFEVLTSLEGPEWAEYERKHDYEPNGFFMNELAFKTMQEQGLVGKYMIVQVLDDGGTFLGMEERGYVIMENGEIALFEDTASQAFVRRAGKVMRVV